MRALILLILVSFCCWIIAFHKKRDINQIGSIFVRQPQAARRERGRTCFTSDERETFLQSNICKPLADFICVQLPKRFGHLPACVLGRRRGYIPAAYSTFCLGTSTAYNVPYHHVFMLIVDSSNILPKSLFWDVIQYISIFFNFLNP